MSSLSFLFRKTYVIILGLLKIRSSEPEYFWSTDRRNRDKRPSRIRHVIHRVVELQPPIQKSVLISLLTCSCKTGKELAQSRKDMAAEPSSQSRQAAVDTKANVQHLVHIRGRPWEADPQKSRIPCYSPS